MKNLKTILYGFFFISILANLFVVINRILYSMFDGFGFESILYTKSTVFMLITSWIFIVIYELVSKKVNLLRNLAMMIVFFSLYFISTGSSISPILFYGSMLITFGVTISYIKDLKRHLA